MQVGILKYVTVLMKWYHYCDANALRLFSVKHCTHTFIVYGIKVFVDYKSSGSNVHCCCLHDRPIVQINYLEKAYTVIDTGLSS